MASPFRFFRKNAKTMLAVFVVLLMLSWVVGDSLMSVLSGNRPAASTPGRSNPQDNEVAVRWDGGSLTNGQVNHLVFEHKLLNEFLSQVHNSGIRTAMEAGVQPSQLSVVMLGGDETEAGVVQTKLYADAARAAGMRVSDDAVAQYLDRLGRNRVSRAEMSEILTKIASRSMYSKDDIFNALREQMLALNYLKSNQFAFLAQTPDQRWDDWLRVNERVIIEAAAVPAESMLLDVKEPTDAELQAFYDKVDENGTKYSEREPLPDFIGPVELPASTPAFRIPRKMDVQFIEANYNSYVENAKAKVTDDEIAKYYEAHKDPMFIKSDVNLIEDKGDKKDGAKPEGENKPASDAKSEPDAKAQPADGAAQKDEKAAPPTADAKQDASKEGKDDAKAKKGAGKDAKKSSLNQVASPFRLVAFQDAEKDAAAKKDDAAKNDDSVKKDAAAAKNSADSKAGAETKTNTIMSPLGGLDLSAPIIKSPPKPKEFQPLEQVKDQIRQAIAEEKAADELNKLMGKIETDLEGVFNKYAGDVLGAEASNKPKPEPPKELTDLKAIAEKNGLKVGSTGALSAVQLRDTPVGKSTVVDSNRPLFNFLFFTQEADMYQPLATMDIDGNRYIAMKTSDTPGRIPPLADVKPEVVKAWKMTKAAELAEKKAQELAKKASEANTPLATFFADDKEIKVVQPDQFAEFSGGDVGIINGQLGRQPYRLSQPKDLVAPGLDFMKEVFKLNDGQVGVAMNHDHSIAYVIRLVEHTPPLAELRSAYLAEANTWPGLQAMVQEHYSNVFSGVRKNFVDAKNIKWERDHDVKRTADGSANESGGG